MCVFATYEEICLLQKLNQYQYKFSVGDIETAIEESTRETGRKHIYVLPPESRERSYSCYRTWQLRYALPYDDPYGLGPNEIDDPIDEECKIYWEHTIEGDPDEQYYEGTDDGYYIWRDCPRIEGSRICQGVGYEFPDARCPMVRDLDNGKIRLDYRYFDILTEVVAKKELAYLFRLLSRRMIPCNVVKELVDKFTKKQAALIWLRALQKAVSTYEIEYLTGIKKHNFHNILYGTSRSGGRKTGGVAQKIEKIMRRNNLDDNLIKWFSMKLFRLASFHSGSPNINLAVDNDFIKTRLASLGFGIQEGEDGKLDYGVQIIPRWWWERENKAEQGLVDIGMKK